ncbi:MAG: hypothetical protein ACE5R5_07695 [Nitrosarchaeum sp.]
MSKSNKEPEKRWRVLEFEDVKDDSYLELQDDYESDKNREDSEV